MTMLTEPIHTHQTTSADVAVVNYKETLIRGHVSDNNQAVCSDASLAALNASLRKVGKVTLWVDRDRGCLLVGHPSVEDAVMFSRAMNWHVFPHQGAYCMGRDMDSVVQNLDWKYRYPDSFYHLLMYVAVGKVFYDDVQSHKWQVAECMKLRVGQFEEGYGRETFVAWMRRQMERLETYSSIPVDSALYYVMDDTESSTSFESSLGITLCEDQLRGNKNAVVEEDKTLFETFERFAISDSFESAASEISVSASVSDTNSASSACASLPANF
ncbi:expressed unknown protein [Seminavis robusta]|uniref:Uncharacterized protein n=1 Tax=Seminavis robusta TaxID=568900 RepID=A0A9N8EGF7_9STRA|nr:expressed unknown protein [Seminavis robusta]|eukprot:Sro1124_g243820.1 n/a (271) ;mRNA; f:19201-20013